MSFSLQAMGRLFFKLKGKINRKTFILSYLFLGFNIFSAPVILGAEFFSANLAGACLLVLFLSLFLYAFAVYIKGFSLNHSGCYSFFLLSLPVVFILSAKYFSFSPSPDLLWKMLVFIFAVLFIYASLMIRIKRLHDLGHSGWWSLLFFLPPLGFCLLIYLAVRQGSLKAKPSSEGSKGVLGLFFNHKGRITRQTFILSFLAWFFIFPVLIVSFYVVLIGLFSNSETLFLSLLLIFGTLMLGYPVFYPYFMIHIKRLHDLGYSGWWSLLLIALALIENLIPLNSRGILLPLLMTIYLAVRQGSLESNRFGESPLASKESQPASLKPS